MLAPKRTVRELKAPLGLGLLNQPGAPPGTAPSTDKLELAKKLANRINLARNLGPDAKGATQQAAEAILKGAGSQPLITVSHRLKNNKISLGRSSRMVAEHARVAFYK